MTSQNRNRYIFLILLLLSAFLPPALALFCGIVFALLLHHPLPIFARTSSKYMLQAAVVGLGFGMNLHDSLAAGRDGMMFTIISVIGVMILGYFIGRMLRLSPKNTHLISAGTAICGGSAIAAIAPVVDADDDDISISLATIFVLNAVALFIFPAIGHWLELSQHQLGIWAAIAIHDTSSVVGAGAAYGEEALKVATTVKLTRALWIIPLALVSALIFKQKGRKVSIPWFILYFIVAMVINTYIALPDALSSAIAWLSHRALSATLFLIGSGLSLSAIRSVGVRPLILGIILWAVISVSTLGVVLFL